MKTKIFFVLLVLSVIFVFSPVFAQDGTKDAANTLNIEGVWNGEPMGGKYYIRQVGNEIFWLGEDNEVSPTWSNIAYGIINGDVITVKWADVPKGSIMQSGNLVDKVESNTRLILESQTGEYFGTSAWTR